MNLIIKDVYIPGGLMTCPSLSTTLSMLKFERTEPAVIHTEAMAIDKPGLLKSRNHVVASNLS